MNVDDTRTAMLHARLPAFRRKVEAARTVIETTLRDHAPCFVAYSGGKDSTAMLWLARQVEPSIEARILLWPESELLGNFDATITAWRSLGANIRDVRLTREHWTDKNHDKWERLNSAAPAASVLIGLRAQESAIRKMSLRRWGVSHLRRDGRWRVCPLAWWTTMDVAAAIAANDLPLIDRYDETIDVRTTTRIIARPELTEMALNEMRARDPSAMHKLRKLYPDSDI